MGRSFDRGGQSRKERMRSKRRAYQQAERDKETREAVLQARRTEMKAVRAKAADGYSEPAAALADVAATHTVVAISQKPGFLSWVINRIFGKAA